MKDVVDDERRRRVHETNHARSELRVAGVSLKCVPLDNWRRTIPANGRAKSARTLSVVAENIPGNRGRGARESNARPERGTPVLDGESR